jgi:2'-5' RNA ligase
VTESKGGAQGALPPAAAGLANTQRRRTHRAENNGGGAEAAAAAARGEEADVVPGDTMSIVEPSHPRKQPSKQPPQPPKPPPPRRPNYFVSARMKLSPQGVATVEDIHANLAELAPELRTAAVGAASAHVTLSVFHLADASEVEKASAALGTLAELPEMAAGGPLRATLENLGHFHHQVLFVGVKDDAKGARLARLAAAARRAIVTLAGVMEDDGGGARGFTPHVTLAKTSKVKWKKPPKGEGGRKGGGAAAVDDKTPKPADVVREEPLQRQESPPPQPRKKNIPTGALLETFAAVPLGVVEVTQLELCSMAAPKDKEGYYAVCAAVPFSPAAVDTIDPSD